MNKLHFMFSSVLSLQWKTVILLKQASEDYMIGFVIILKLYYACTSKCHNLDNSHDPWYKCVWKTIIFSYFIEYLCLSFAMYLVRNYSSSASDCTREMICWKFKWDALLKCCPVLISTIREPTLFDELIGIIQTFTHRLKFVAFIWICQSKTKLISPFEQKAHGSSKLNAFPLICTFSQLAQIIKSSYNEHLYKSKWHICPSLNYRRVSWYSEIDRRHL